MRSWRGTVFPRLRAADFLTIEVWTKLGRATVYALFAIRFARRRIEILGTTTNPDSAFMAQRARDVGTTESEKSPPFAGVTHLLIDHDTKYTAQFEALLRDTGIEFMRALAKCPQADGVAERFDRSVRCECLRKLILAGIGSLQRPACEYVEFHYRERAQPAGVAFGLATRAARLMHVPHGRIAVLNIIPSPNRRFFADVAAGQPSYSAISIPTSGTFLGGEFGVVLLSEPHGHTAFSFSHLLTKSPGFGDRVESVGPRGAKRNA